MLAVRPYAGKFQRSMNKKPTENAMVRMSMEKPLHRSGPCSGRPQSLRKRRRVAPIAAAKRVIRHSGDIPARVLA
jgi:hypothetical protein